MNSNERSSANDLQIKTYFRSYDRYYRLSKLIALKDNLENRESLKNKLRQFYGDEYFNYDDLTYINYTNGILADAVSEMVMYCEDYLILLKFIREKFFFIKNIVSYSSGSVVNIASKLRNLSEKEVEKLFFMPEKCFVNECFKYFHGDDCGDEKEKYFSGIKRIILYHKAIIVFFEKYRKFQLQYKHGLNLAIAGVGGDIADDLIEERKKNYSGNVFVFSNMKADEAFRSGGIIIPDISSVFIRENLNELFSDKNLLHFDHRYEINFDELISVGSKICSLIGILYANRTALMQEGEKSCMDVSVPSANKNRITSYLYKFPFIENSRRYKIDDFQIKL